MSDLIDAIENYLTSTCMSSGKAELITEGIIDLIITRIPPLVWYQYCGSGSSSAKTVFNTEYVAEFSVEHGWRLVA